MNISEFKISEEFLEAQPMVYARRLGAYGAENAHLTERFKSWVTDNGYMTDDAVILGIARDNPGTTPPDECRYDVCLLGDHDVNADWISSGTLSAGKYAVLELPHTAEAVALAWQEGIHFLMKKGCTPDFDRHIMERYKKSLVDSHRCEMLFPIL